MNKTTFIITLVIGIISPFLSFKFRALAIKAEKNYKEKLATTFFGLSLLFLLAFCFSLLILISFPEFL